MTPRHGPHLRPGVKLLTQLPLLNLARLAVWQGDREGKTPSPAPRGPVHALVLDVKGKPLRGALRAALTAPGEPSTGIALRHCPKPGEFGRLTNVRKTENSDRRKWDTNCAGLNRTTSETASTNLEPAISAFIIEALLL